MLSTVFNNAVVFLLFSAIVILLICLGVWQEGEVELGSKVFCLLNITFSYTTLVAGMS